MSRRAVSSVSSGTPSLYWPLKSTRYQRPSAVATTAQASVPGNHVEFGSSYTFVTALSVGISRVCFMACVIFSRRCPSSEFGSAASVHSSTLVMSTVATPSLRVTEKLGLSYPARFIVSAKGVPSGALVISSEPSTPAAL